MDQAAERAGGDFYILPSSIHEVLIVPDNGEMGLKDLEAMVKEVNATQVAPADKLRRTSDSRSSSGAGLGIWGAINLMEGYGNDNPGSKSQGMKQLMAGGGVALIGITLVPLLSGLF